MLKSLIKASGIVVGLLLSGLASAVGMGGINLTTSLGEPLKLEIELEVASKAEINDLTVHLASPEMFKAVGLDYPYNLPQLKFQVETHGSNGQPYLKITSVQPINEPFVSLLVELNWPSGKLLREYTFLLDPPGYAADQPKAAEIKPVEPIAIEEPATTPQQEEVPSAEIAPAPTEEEMPVAPVPEIASRPSEHPDETPAKTNVASGTITVKRGDTLYQIASQAKSPDISLERMLVALYRANADAFDGKNMNRLRAGKILRMPEQPELDEVTQAQAAKEIHAQVADWHAYRQRLAAASGAAAEQAPSQEASGKINASVADQAPPAKESAKEVVRLSKGEAPGDNAAVGGNAKNAQDKLHVQEEEAVANSKTLKENQERAALLEKNVKAMQRLLELKNQTAATENKGEPAMLGALPKVTPVSAVAAASAVQPASAVQAASAVQPASAVQLTAKPKVEIPQPSLLDELLGGPLYLAGGAVVVLGLGGLGLALRRRAQGRKRGLLAEDAGSASGRITAPIAPSPETGDFTNTVVDATGSGNSLSGDVDPISEADLFLNFGRDEQAEEILKDALLKNPANHQIHLKLLSIYLNRRNVTAFAAIARQLQDSGDKAAWEQASIMGLKLEPNNPMYGGDGKTAEVVPTAASKPAPEAMFDMGMSTPPPAAMDFDLGLATTKVPTAAAEPSHDSTLVLNAPMDFDVTGSRPSESAQNTDDADTSSKHLDDLIFDVTAGHEPIPATAKQEEPKEAPEDADTGISFLLDIPGANKFEAPPEPKVAKSSMEIGLAEISLNMNEPVTPTPAPSPAAEGKDEQWQDVATKLDLANAYKEMGDAAGAREILEEVVRDGDDQQRTAAEALLQQL